VANDFASESLFLGDMMTRAMPSTSGEAARRYHEATKHSELGLRSSAHYLDWDSRPSPFKTYAGRPSIDLPHDFPHPRKDSLNATDGNPFDETKPVTIKNLAEILFFSAGLTRRMRIGREHYYMRAASATGALYPIELYVVSTAVEGLNDGVYHFNPLEFSLVNLRDGDYSFAVKNATGGDPYSTPLAIVLTSLAWRNAWKYEARSYRHWFWDAGVIIANLLAICSSERLQVELAAGFVDVNIDQLLGLRPSKEATVAIAEVGRKSDLPENLGKRNVPRLDFHDESFSDGEVEYPIIWEANRASEFHDTIEVDNWIHSLKSSQTKASGNYPNFPLQHSVGATSSLADTILTRGSTRRFVQKPISFEALSAIINSSTGSIPLDFLPPEQTLIECYLIANDVTGLPSGAYHFDRTRNSLQQLKEGRMRYFSGYLSLEQHLFSDASAVFFLMTDLDWVLKSLGDRGYRAAQLEAGIRAGKIYLSSYALGVGASGSTFYDDAVTEFFSPHAEKMSPMIEVGVGVPAYKARPGSILPQLVKTKK
jgi:SagB-type dehydrogenase family enzyme